MIKEDYVSFEVAELMKEKGFDDSCCRFVIEADGTSHRGEPTSQMAKKWLRETYGIYIEVFCPVVDSTGEPVTYNVVISDLNNSCLAYDTPLEDIEYTDVEKATDEAIKYTLENLVK